MSVILLEIQLYNRFFKFTISVFSIRHSQISSKTLSHDSQFDNPGIPEPVDCSTTSHRILAPLDQDKILSKSSFHWVNSVSDSPGPCTECQNRRAIMFIFHLFKWILINWFIYSRNHSHLWCIHNSSIPLCYLSLSYSSMMGASLASLLSWLVDIVVHHWHWHAMLEGFKIAGVVV